ncbi:conserved repeat domain-containing protein/fimbrial isopeptide formation D2 domain-containing protein [Leifsonia sp. 98AMF]|nr:conserved repeat domain-containing protein/fimbrial isopeptide formation D2 domain-containing protein [Leifsonia sp. 197AMF]SDJ48594.1 conserved repeat domain-containing protein/fimbrial isopeptide formation D2 domain-containing protein [Leifsonia sp. 466MF]SDK26322.1 conserved repeat domain-containing protein/fimbrial isopeptide formation D2 domain-containing protein [Leifsonia sp. 157MF]SDN68444.1 conserved repeat domain-containing protein/fimbrial isopeptide formation D2 domain-containing 
MSARQRGLTSTKWGGLRRAVAGIALAALATGGLSAVALGAAAPADAAASPSQQWLTAVGGSAANGGTLTGTFGTTGVTATVTASGDGTPARPFTNGTIDRANGLISPDAPTGAPTITQGVVSGQSLNTQVRFSKPVIAPRMHFMNVDGSLVRINNAIAGDGITATRAAGNSVFTVDSTNLINSPARRADNSFCQQPDGSNPTGACGTVAISNTSGLVSAFNFANSDQNLGGDSWQWDLSFPSAPLTKQFTPGAINPGGTSQLTFTIANPANEGQSALSPLGFTDTLPAGVTLKDGTVTNNGQCGTPTTSGITAGSNTVTAGAISVAVGATCTITVNVTATTQGTYTNDNSNLTTTVANLVPNANTSLTVTTAQIPTVGCTTDPAIFNTGYNQATDGQLANGAADPRWTVAGGYTGLNYVNTTTFPAGPSAAALPPAGATYAPAQAGKVNNLWSNSQSGKSQWISAQYVDPANGQNQADGYGDWYYRYQFNLDPAVDPATFQLDMSWLSDNTVAGVWVNNVAQQGANLPQDPNNAWGGGGFNSGNAAKTSMAGDWKTGLNTILVQVKSYYTAEGFDAEVTSTALCPTPTLTVTKQVQNATSGDNSAPLQVGDTVNYTVTATNTSKVPFTTANPATITDDMSDVIDDADLVASSLKATVDGAAVTVPTFASPTLSWSGPLDAGKTVTITYTVTYTGEGNSVLNNNACVPDGTQTADTLPCAPTTLPAPKIDDWKTVSASANPLVAGSTLTYTLHFENTGTTSGPVNKMDNLSDVTDDATVTTEPATASGALTGTRTGDIIAVTGTLAAGATSTITYTATVKPDGQRGNNVAANYLVNQNELPPTTCQPVDPQRPDCTVTNMPDLAVSKSVDPASGTAVKAGDVLTYTLTFDNTKGTDTAPVTGWSDDLSKILDDADVTTQPTSSIASLRAGAISNGSFPVTGTVPAGEVGTITYTVTVKPNGQRGDNDLGNALSNGGPCAPGLCTENPVRSFSITKTASTPVVHPGDTVTYTVTLANTGKVDYTADEPATITDDLSKVLDDATYVPGSATNGATVSGLTLTWSGPLPVGGTQVITYQVTAGPVGTGDGTLANTVSGPPDSTCITCETVTPLQAFRVTKTADATEVVPGQKITYTITVSNTGTAAYTAANPASFTDDLSKVLDDATYNNDATSGATYAAPTLAWSGALAVGQTVTVLYSVTVDDPDTGDQTLDNAVVTPPDGGCPTTTDNPDCRSVIPSGSFTVTKAADKETVKPGDTVTYTVTVKNTGKVAYTAGSPAAFRDDLTNVLDDAKYNGDATQGAKVEGATLTWSGPLGVGQTLTVTYSVTVNKPDTGNLTLVNAVVPTVPGGTCDPQDSCITHTPLRAFTVAKTVSTTAAVKPGAKVSYTVTVKNTGAVAFTTEKPASFTDDMSDVLDDATYNNDATHGAVLQGTTLSWSGALDLGQTIAVTYSVTVKQAGAGNGRLVNTVDPPVDGSCDPAGACDTSTPLVPPAAGTGLAFTGSDIVAPGVIALLLLALGGAVMIVRRRRRNGETQDNA